MADKEETREERFERQRRQLQEGIMRHRQKMETDPKYREETENFLKLFVTFGNDTED